MVALVATIDTPLAFATEATVWGVSYVPGQEVDWRQAGLEAGLVRSLIKTGYLGHRDEIQKRYPASPAEESVRAAEPVVEVPPPALPTPVPPSVTSRPSGRRGKRRG